MHDIDYLLKLVQSQSESEAEWTLQNISNAVLVDMIMELLKLLSVYQAKTAEYEENNLHVFGKDAGYTSKGGEV